jgi:5-methylcytosine-specific restriction protein A
MALRDGLPALLKRLVAATNHSLEDFTIYGRAGEMNRHFPYVPWVAICYSDITTSTKRGYYIVLLFHEKMEGCFLSLNQGYTQFDERFATKELALLQVEQSASRCLAYLERRPGYVRGPIDLDASGDLGIGYERGAILSKWYPRSADGEEADFAADLGFLLDQYERLLTFMGPRLDLDLPVTEEALQGTAALLASKTLEWQPPPPGAVPIPPPVPGSNSTRYARDARVCARAQQLAAFRCEADVDHLTFPPRRKLSDNFVESHHLVPMSLQRKFSVSLDVVENVVALCPNCHRLLHHGRNDRKRPILRKLFKDREAGLGGREIWTTLEQLIAFYSGNLGMDD